MTATVVPSVIVNLKVLSQDNYKEWSFRVKTYLLAEGLWEVVTDNPPDFHFNAWSRDNAKALHTIHISCGDNAYAFIEDISVAKEAWQILAKKFNPIEVSHDADVGSDIHTNQTPIDGDTGPKQDMEIKAIEDVGSDIHTNQALGDVGTKKDMGIVEGGESVNDNLIYKPFFKNLDSSEWDAVMKFIKIHPEAVRARHPLNGKTALHLAAFDERENIVKELVQLMTVKDLEIKDHDGAIVLTYVLRCYDRRKMIEMVKCLVEKNKKLLIVDFHVRTALFNAIWAEEVDIVKEWVRLMTTEDLEIQDNDGDTALAHAVVREDTDKMIEIVKCLVEKNKKLLTIVDSTGKTPLHKAAFHETVDIVKELVQLMTVKDLEIKDHDGATALAHVVRCYDRRKMVEMVKCLVEKNKKLLTIVDSTGKTPLHKAAFHENVDIVKELVQLMTVKDLEIKDHHGATALAHAVTCYDRRKMIEMVKCLVEKNKKLLTIVDSTGKTPLHKH